jgi:hypothetical protein
MTLLSFKIVPEIVVDILSRVEEMDPLNPELFPQRTGRDIVG